MSGEARRWVGALLVLGAVTVVLFWPVFDGLLRGSPRYFEWDVAEQYWPDLVYLCDALHDGELPLWNPYDRGGYPYYADPQAGAYHPLNWAICAAGRSPGLGWATARVVLGFSLAGVFGLLWLRRLDVPMSGALLGAAVIEAAPFMRHNWELNLSSALAWLPLMLWAADRAMVERRFQDGVVLGGAVALCAWVGSPPALWLAATYTAAYGLVRLAMETQQHGRGALLRGLGVGALGLVVSAGLTAAVLVPGLTLAEHSVQAGRSYASIAEGALELSDLRALVSAQPGNHLYVGLIPLTLGALALRRRQALPMFFAITALVAVLMALGDQGPLFSAAFEWVPGVRLFRLPHRYEAWLGPAVGGLAALGVRELSELDVARWRAALRRSALISIALGLPLALFAPALGLLGLGLGAALFALLRGRAELSSVAFGGALAMLCLADVSATLPPDRHMRSGTPPGSEEAAARVLPFAPETDVRFRYMDEFGIACRSGTRLRRRDLRGYQDPLLLHAYERVIAGLRETPALAAQYNVRYALQGPHFIHGWNRHYLPPPAELRRRPDAVAHGAGVTELSDALPFAYWVPLESVERAIDRPAALVRVRELAPAPIAVLDGAAWPSSASAPGTAQRARPAPRQIPALAVELERDWLGFQIAAPTAGVVVINETFYPGWRATVDGETVPVFRANALVRALPVAAGVHRVEMRFDPSDGAPLRWLLLLTLALSLLVLLVALARRRLCQSGCRATGIGEPTGSPLPSRRRARCPRLWHAIKSVYWTVVRQAAGMVR